jgi:tetratricopeptide (TPR) repeat protein
MLSLKVCSVFCSVWLCALPLSAQIDFSKYFDENSVPLLDIQDHLDPGFRWNMTGEIQIFMNEGINFLKEGNPQLGITNLNEVLKRDSLSWVAYYYRGICHKNLLQFEEAKNDLLAAQKIDPRQAATCIELGEIYHLQHTFSKASSEYEKATEIDPRVVQAYYNLGSLFLEKGDIKKAFRYYQKCNEVDSRFAQAYMMQGLLKFKVKKKDNESITLFNKAIEADSTYSLTYFWRGLAYISLDQPVEALKSWNTLLQLAPENFLYTLMRGCLYIELGDFDNAFTDLRKAIRAHAVDDERFVGGQTILDKQIDLQYAANYLITNGYGLNEKAFGHLKKGFCLLLAGKRREAIEEFRKAELIQTSATVFFMTALAYEHFDDHNTALKYYNKALQLDNDIFDAHKKRSVYRSELKDWAGAEKDFNEMFRLQPNSPTVYRLRGLARSNQQDYKGAVEDLTKFITTDSSDYETFRTRSVCFLMLGEEKAANDDMRMLLTLENSWELYETVAGNYLILKDTIKAIEVWQDYADRRPSVFIPHMEMARIYIYQENWDSAKLHIDRLLPLITPEHMTKKYAEILYWDGRIDYERALYEDAISKFSKALKNDDTYLDAKYFRARAYQKVGQPKKARADLKDLKTLHHRDSEILYSTIPEY